MAALQVTLVSPDREVWAGEAEMVIARTVDGELGILPGHISLLGELVSWPVRIKRSGEPDLVAAVHGGFLSVTQNGVSVLAETVELADEVDAGRARQAFERASQAGADEEATAAQQRARARLRAAGENV